jgi:NADH-quinone oxidoreductase subunit H
MQFRLGPRRVGFHGAGQTLADAIKLMVKEDIIPTKADRWIFTIAPILVFVPAYMIYIVVPWGNGNSFIARDLNIGILYVVAITSIAVVGIIMAGWASDNKYALLGAMRSAAQLVSYEVPGVLVVLGPVILAGSLSMQQIVGAQGNILTDWFWFKPWGFGVLGFLAYFISALAETNTTPFDLPEADSELVAGYNTEYSGMKFAFFFLAEFSNNFAICGIAATLFFGGWRAPLPFLPDQGWFGVAWFFLKASVGVFVFMWIRATYPRVRVDQLMEFAWKFVVPLAIVYVMVVAFLVCIGWVK